MVHDSTRSSEECLLRCVGPIFLWSLHQLGICLLVLAARIYYFHATPRLLQVAFADPLHLGAARHSRVAHAGSRAFESSARFQTPRCDCSRSRSDCCRSLRRANLRILPEVCAAPARRVPVRTREPAMLGIFSSSPSRSTRLEAGATHFH